MLSQGCRRVNVGVCVNADRRAAGIFNPLVSQLMLFDCCLCLWNAARSVLSAQGDDTGRFHAFAVEVETKCYSHHSQISGTSCELFESENLVVTRP